jgi:Amt family ammonium transporter
VLAVILIGTPVPAAAMAERSRFWPMAVMSALLAGIVIPFSEYLSRHGWLARLGFLDEAGASWLHVAAAAVALAGVLAVRSRSGKYHRDGSASMIPGHSLPFAGIGALAIFVGWIPYLSVCAVLAGFDSVAACAMNAILGASAAGLVAMVFGKYRYGKPDVILTIMGLLGGLVAVSAAADHIGTRAAVLMGVVAGLVVPVAVVWLDLLAHLDDPTGVIAIHGIGGAWGTIAAGLLLPGSIGHRLHQFGIQIFGVIVIAALSFVLGAATCWLLSKLTSLRLSEDEEFEGLDLAEHDIGAYPDFQQTTIKSYHLREA